MERPWRVCDAAASALRLCDDDRFEFADVLTERERNEQIAAIKPTLGQ